jgi:phospholipase/lecithinase/hemolysin
VQALGNAVEPLFIEATILAYNAMLQAQLRALQVQHPSAAIDYVDMYTPLLAAMTANQRQDLGLVELRKPCLPFDRGFDLLVQPLPLTATPCSDPNVVANYDLLHLNSVIQTQVVAEVIKAHLIV